MKRLMIPSLAITLLAGLHTAVNAQNDAQTKPADARLYDSLQASPAAHHSGQAQADVNPGLPQRQGQRDTILTWWNQQPQSAPYRPPGWTDNWETLGLYRTYVTADLSLSPADDALRAHLGLPKDQGLIVTGLAANASAAAAGVQQNDVFLKLGDAPLAKPEDLEEGLKAAGDKPTALTVLRGGKKVVVQVQPHVRVTMGPVQPEPPAFWLGVSVSDLEPALRSQLKLPQSQGLMTIGVYQDSPAAKAGVKVHDILLSLAEKPLDSQQKLIEIVQASGEKSIPLELIREGKTMKIDVTPMRRKPVPPRVVKVHGNELGEFVYQYVRPGVVTTAPNAVDSNGDVLFRAQVSEPKQDQPTAVAKRIDELDAEIKALRAAIEDLSKILKEKK